MRLTSFSARIGAAQSGWGRLQQAGRQAQREGGREGFGAPLIRREVLGSGAFPGKVGSLLPAAACQS